MTTDQRLQALIETTVNWYFESNPFVATFVGRHEFDSQVPDLSREAIEDQLAKSKEFLAQLEAINPDELSIDGQIDRKLLEIQLKDGIRQVEVLRSHEKHPGSAAGMLMNVAYIMLTREYAPLLVRGKDLLQRLQHTERLLEQSRQLIVNPPRIFTEIAIKQTQGGIMFFEGLIPMIKQQAGAFAGMIIAPVQKTIEAFQKHLAWLKELLPQSNGDFAVGEVMFTEMLQENHLLDYTAETLLAKGWEIFESTRQEMANLSREIDPNRSWEEILEGLKAEHPTAEGLLDYYRQELARVKQFVIDQGIVDIPANEKLVIEATPAFQRAVIPYAAYMQPAPFEKDQTGHFWVTPVDPNSPPEEQEQKLQGHSCYKIPVTTLHEGYPGHHLQLVWANTAGSLIRKLSGSTLFAEGWAFYCEELMEQLGYISDPKVKLARLNDQLWRAARIIIDASLHTGRMSFGEAVDFLVEKAHLEPVNAIAEVSRYTMSPTQPMSYLMGKLELLKLVNEYRKRKENHFDLKSFHNQLLSYGTIPPALVRKALFAGE
ncbi:MAG: DUF885 domain-containing protein [Bacillota bacterium]